MPVRNRAKKSLAQHIGPLTVTLVDQTDVCTNYARNENKHLRCFPKCNPSGHQGKTFCGTSYEFKFRVSLETPKQISIEELNQVIEESYFGYAFFMFDDLFSSVDGGIQDTKVGDIKGKTDILCRRDLKEDSHLDKEQTKVTLEDKEFEIAYKIDPPSWFYPLGGPKRFRGAEHHLRFILYKRNCRIDDDEFDDTTTAVGVYSSGSFTITSTQSVRASQKRKITEVSAANNNEIRDNLTF